MVSTHSRPKAAAIFVEIVLVIFLFQHTAARRRLHKSLSPLISSGEFQHTAARRRLLKSCVGNFGTPTFQHTAARRRLLLTYLLILFQVSSFNTQPPEGGCNFLTYSLGPTLVSTHSRPKAAACSFRPSA